MSANASDIVWAALQAATEEMRKQGLEHEIASLPRIVREVLGERDQTVNVVLVTPTGQAGETLKESIARLLSEKLGKIVEVQERADASLIGGAVLLFGDERIDLSVRGALTQLEDQIRTGGLAAAV